MRYVIIVVGAILVVFGLQGVGVVGGSAMTGELAWAIIGPVLAVIGLVLVGFGARRSR